MDELLIEDKKYVSSKRAAKMTGYAKDYVGQLCREGRVPARLVGRSWYVLEAAIQDHRFGGPESSPAAPEKAATPATTWEQPRYEAADVETFPSVNRLREEKPEMPQTTPSEAAKNLQETWEAWFDRFQHSAPAAAPDLPAAVEEEVREEVAAIEEQKPIEAIEVPIRAIYHPQYQPRVEEIVPQRIEREESVENNDQRPFYPDESSRHMSKTAVQAIKVVGILWAVFMVIATMFGSGTFDTYATSGGPAGLLAGVAVYKR